MDDFCFLGKDIFFMKYEVFILY